MCLLESLFNLLESNELQQSVGTVVAKTRPSRRMCHAACVTRKPSLVARPGISWYLEG